MRFARHKTPEIRWASKTPNASKRSWQQGYRTTNSLSAGLIMFEDMFKRRYVVPIRIVPLQRGPKRTAEVVVRKLRVS
jgi:hypothetical protein